MDTPLPTPRSLRARSPFDKPFVSVVLRSSDGVEFHALEGSLVDASPVFADMLSAPQASSGDGPDQDDTRADANTRQRGAIELPETNDALRFLLPFCHNMAPDPPPSSFDEFKPAMRAWVKYRLRGDALERALDALEPFLLREPLRAFALAAQLAQPKLMRLAARACLFLPNIWSIDAAELEDISAHTYRQLLKYQDAAVSKV
ncbi:hypothetical protein BD413DRAFT_485424, partial [Trametes elegans]